METMIPADHTLRARRAINAARAVAALYAGVGLVAMWLAPRVPYADAWRFLGHFLQAPFPQDIFTPDNGHHEVLPNAVRVVDLHVFAAQQWLQVTVGIALALSTVAVLWRGIAALTDARLRAAASLAVVLGLFWLGNIRVLAHGNESVHAYSVTLFLVLGMQVLASRRDGKGGLQDAAVAAVCGIAAAFSFGSGIACFVAYAAVLTVGRAPWRQWIVLTIGLLSTLALMRWDGGDGIAIQFAPLQQIELLLRWLAGPFVYAFWLFLDPALADKIPLVAARAPIHAIAQAYETTFGPVMLARWPHVLFGLAGLIWLGATGWRAWRRRAFVALHGIGLACFAAAVGMMIVLVRFDYFGQHPNQLLAARYVVWSSLFWAGLSLAVIAQSRVPSRALAMMLIVAVMLLPSQLWMAELGARMRVVAEQTALAAAVGVIEPELPLGESVLGELAAALPVVREARVAVFAWSEAQWLGRAPVPGQLLPIDVQDVHVMVVANNIGVPGRRVRFTHGGVPNARVLLLDRDGIVRGIAMRDRGEQWIGWMQGTEPAGTAPQITIPKHL